MDKIAKSEAGEETVILFDELSDTLCKYEIYNSNADVLNGYYCLSVVDIRIIYSAIIVC